MNRETARTLLPDYVAGDLGAAALADVERALADDGDLRALAGQLRREQELVARALAREPSPDVVLATWPTLPVAPAAPVEPKPSRSARLAIVTAAAAAAMLAGLFGWWVTGLPGPITPDVPGLARAYVLVDDGELELLDATDPVALEGAFDAAGVPPAVRVVPDLSAIGLRTVGVVILPGKVPGVAVVYERDGVRYLCQMYRELAATRPAETVVDMGDLRIEAWREGDVSLAAWNAPGMVCVFSARVPLAQLLAVVQERVRLPG